MVSRAFVKVGDIVGESNLASHPGWIDVVSWAWGGTLPVNIAYGSSSGTISRGQLEPFVFTKYLDRSSPALAYGMASGRPFKSATFEAVKASGDETPLVYVSFKFSGVLLSAYHTSGMGDASQIPTESVSLAFHEVQFMYVEQTAEGGAGVKPKMTWDIPSGKGSIA